MTTTSIGSRYLSTKCRNCFDQEECKSFPLEFKIQSQSVSVLTFWLTMAETVLFTINLSYKVYLRIEVHFFCLYWEMKGHWSCVNLVKREALLKDLHTTIVLSFPNANKKKVYFNPHIYAKATNNPWKVEKINVNFWSHYRCLSLENICHSFLMLHCRQMLWECKDIVIPTCRFDVFAFPVKKNIAYLTNCMTSVYSWVWVSLSILNLTLSLSYQNTST